MRTGIIFGTVLLVGVAAGAVTPTKRGAAHPYRHDYVRDTFGKRAAAGVGARAALGQALNHPRQWGRGPSGFGKRLGSGMATHVVKNSIQYPVAALRHEDLHYHRSPDPRFGPRLRHALVSTVWIPKTTDGKKTVAAGRISGAMGSGLISRAWQPAAARGVAGGVASGGITLGASAASNVAREFWPRKKHTVGQRQAPPRTRQPS
jgi:hypothetical protein